MKHLKYIAFTAAFACLINLSFAQNINWKNLQSSERHIVNLNVGFDNGANAGVGYGYHLKTRFPVVLNIEHSMPFGENLADDFKTKIGGQANVIRANNFLATVKAYGVIRRFENDFARLMNFGSEFSATGGFYKKQWYAAAEFGFDKAITTHVKHSDLMKEYNPGLETGWYIPTGGNFFYGVQGGYSFRRVEVYAKVGKTLAQDLTTRSAVPYYFQLGWNVKW